MSNLNVSHDEIGYGVPQDTLALPFAAMKTIPCETTTLRFCLRLVRLISFAGFEYYQMVNFSTLKFGEN